MKKFVFRSSIIIIPLLAVFFGVNFYQFHKYHTASEVYEAIELCTKTSSYEGLILGDSVAHQIFNPSTQHYSDKYLFAATNNAITIFGNYLLLVKFYRSNPQLKEVKLIFRPDGFSTDINPKRFYQYVVQPFYDNDYITEIDPEIKNKVETIFTEKRVNSSFYRNLYSNFPTLRQNFLTKISYEEKTDKNDISLINEIYLKKIISFCTKNNILLNITSSPVSNKYSKADFLKVSNTLQNKIGKEYFSNYLDSILFFNDSEFLDEVHFTGEAINNNLETFMREML